MTYWLAEAKDPELKVQLSEEHKDRRWAQLNNAMELAKFEDMQKLLMRAEEYLTGKARN